MKKILILVSLIIVCVLVGAKNNLSASSAQDSDFKIQFILARREGQRDILIAEESLQTHKLDAIKSAQERLAATSKKLLAFSNQLATNKYRLDGTQVANDLKDIQDLMRKVNETGAQLKKEQESLEGVQ